MKSFSNKEIKQNLTKVIVNLIVKIHQIHLDLEFKIQLVSYQLRSIHVLGLTPDSLGACRSNTTNGLFPPRV